MEGAVLEVALAIVLAVATADALVVVDMVALAIAVAIALLFVPIVAENSVRVVVQVVPRHVKGPA